MTQTIELADLDLRYQRHRLRDQAREARLLQSLRQCGIVEPLQGVDAAGGKLLLNGFKRYRCAKKLGISSVPYVSLAEEEGAAILRLMRAATDNALNILEQARFLEELTTVHQMTSAQVADHLVRTVSWVSMRRNLLKEMTPGIQAMLFGGDFPIYCYMYHLRPFMRMKSASPQDVERFMQAVAGQGRSVRDLNLLARAYFQGGAGLREAIEQGNLDGTLKRIRDLPEDQKGCNAAERALLKDLEIVQKYINRAALKCQDSRLRHRVFFAQANLLAGGLLAQLPLFQERMKAFYDRSRNAAGDSETA